MYYKIRVADEVWIVVASLHRSHPDREDFAIAEIMAEAESANVAGSSPLRPGIKQHVAQHCVANKRANPGRYRMLFETASGRRRLYRPGDPCDPARVAGKDVPRRDEVPACYHQLIDWYFADYADHTNHKDTDPILALRGLGKEIWRNEAADDYVRRLRKDWQ